MKGALKSIIPTRVLSAYHFTLAFLAALLYRFPSRYVTVVAVTGTKGKSSTLEFLNAIAEAAGKKTALASTIRFKMREKSKPNKKRMTTPGRFFMQRFLSYAAERCDIAFLEMTSEGARQFRHRFINFDALAFINLAPEHIESHGSLEAYADAKFEIAKQLARSSKRPRVMVANVDDPASGRYLTIPVEHVLPFSLSAAAPFEAGENGGYFTFEGTRITVKLPGDFSLKNALAAATIMRALGFSLEDIARGIESLTRIPGRAETITEGQAFPVVVDYAHTPDSLRALYGAYGSRRKICVLGSTGGGRDMWKRPVMGAVADEMCDTIILTNEDPYDEDPRSIIDMIAHGISKKTPEIIMDRREAIRHAVTLAEPNDVVLITGKGTDPTIQLARGKSEKWSDAEVAREELQKIRSTKH